MGGPKRILIVDDDPDVHLLLGAALAGPERQIESTYDGAAGLARVQTEKWDLVMTDVNMPEMDGMALIERIRKIRPETPVVVMTVANTPENIIQAIREQAFSYFSKPFKLNAVAEIVAHALESVPAEDDIQVLSANPQWLTLRLRCKLETADRIVQFFRELGKHLPAAEQENVAAAFREILLNAIEHGGGSDPDKKVVITHIRAEHAVFYYVRDPGPGFSIHDLPHAAISNPVESPYEHVEVREQLGLRPGGFGIMMSQKMVDELIYNQAGNEVLLIKYLR